MQKVLFVSSFDKENVALKPMIGTYKNPLWFPRNIIFEFDEKLFEKLNDAYNKGDQKLLNELWSKAKRWQSEENSK